MYRYIGSLLLILLISGSSFSQPATIDPNGYNVFFYPNGNISSEGIMRDGKPDGFWKTYYESGILKTEGARQNFELDSIWNFYNSDGNLERSISYLEGKKSGLEKLFTDEVIVEKIPFVNNQRQGEGRFYYENGALYRVVNFENNLEEGKGLEYAQDKRIITILNYRNGFIRSIEKINRYNKLGKRKGYWIEYWDNDLIKEEGNWTNGVRNGIFKFFTKKGDLDRIEVYKGGELVEGAEAAIMLDIRKEYYEDGTLKMVGSYKEGSKQGIFREYSKEGEIINSYVYDNNVKTGEGVVDPEGKFQGTWKMYYPTGEIRAEGGYENGLKEGDWVFYFTDSKIEQKGTYSKDLPTGGWKWYYDDGKLLREERFRKGREDGLLVEYDREGGEIIKGEFIDGLRTGPWFYQVNDHTEEGDYLDGEKHGMWVYTFDNGEVNFKGEFSAGVPMGKHRWYYSNGKLKEEGKYKSGEKHSSWKLYEVNGAIKMVIKYDYGEVIRIGGGKLESGKQTSDEVN